MISNVTAIACSGHIIDSASPIQVTGSRLQNAGSANTGTFAAIRHRGTVSATVTGNVLDNTSGTSQSYAMWADDGTNLNYSGNKDTGNVVAAALRVDANPHLAVVEGNRSLLTRSSIVRLPGGRLSVTTDPVPVGNLTNQTVVNYVPYLSPYVAALSRTSGSARPTMTLIA
jgi:hypothetical protein